jgi:hypothetical protein
MVAFPKGYDSGEQMAKPTQVTLTGFAIIFLKSSSQPIKTPAEVNIDPAVETIPSSDEF